jgi:hypothetical protein
MENSIDDKKKMGCIPKSIKYEKERKEILNKIINILGMSDSDMKFYLWDLDNNLEKQTQIMDLKDDISKYFTSKTSSVFRKADDETKRSYLSLLKVVFKEMGYEIIVSGKSIKRDGISYKTSIYYINLV